MFSNIREFIEIVNSVFPDSRRGVLKKPSFLSEENTYMHETEILSAKKLRILEKQIIVERNHILTIFIRRILKLALVKLRTANRMVESQTMEIEDLYCLAQVCYEIGNVEEESQISAFYHLLLKNIRKKEENPPSSEGLEK